MKRLGIIVFLTAMALCTMAQPRLRQKEMYIGIHGGVLFTKTLFTPEVAGSVGLPESTLLSGNGGLVFRYAGHKCCGLQVEVNYMQRGWREQVAEDGLDVNYKRTLDYIEIPFLTHIFFGKKMVRGFVNLGPQVGFCFNEGQSGTQHPTQREQYNTIDHIVDWGVTGGVGMLVRTPKAGVFQLEARFGYSLGNYFNNQKTDYFSASNPMNLSVNIGYLWEIKPHYKQR